MSRKNIEKLSFEQSLEQLEAIVERIESAAGRSLTRRRSASRS